MIARGPAGSEPLASEKEERSGSGSSGARGRERSSSVGKSGRFPEGPRNTCVLWVSSGGYSERPRVPSRNLSRPAPDSANPALSSQAWEIHFFIKILRSFLRAEKRRDFTMFS